MLARTFFHYLNELFRCSAVALTVLSSSYFLFYSEVKFSFIVFHVLHQFSFIHVAQNLKHLSIVISQVPHYSPLSHH